GESKNKPAILMTEMLKTKLSNCIQTLADIGMILIKMIYKAFEYYEKPAESDYVDGMYDISKVNKRR
ncbi:15084_t:CDS:1, partial [Dentiscutata erythropus]